MSNRLDLFHCIEIRFDACQRSELFYYRAFVESHIIFISRNQLVRVYCRSFLDQVKKRTFFLFSVDDECTAENLMTGSVPSSPVRTIYFAVGQLTFQFLAYFVEVRNFFVAQSQSFFFVVKLRYLV